jgi:DNA polymerase III epsilon subunit-like protein
MNQPVKLPVFDDWEKVPANLKTKTQLYKSGYNLAPNQEAKATKWSKKYGENYPLYEIGEAIPKRALTDKQKAGIEKAKATNIARTTCQGCGVCYEEIRHSKNRLCRDCSIERYTIQAGREACLWAAQLLREKDFVVIDVETTGLDAKAEVIEIAIYNAAGESLMNTLVKPTVPVNESARAVHRITDEELANAPTLAAIESDLRAALSSAGRVIAFSDGFDHKKLNHSLSVWGLAPAGTFEDAQKRYSAYVGEWSNKYNDIRRQGLYGGHRAAGDCLRLLEVLKHMADVGVSTPGEFVETENPPDVGGLVNQGAEAPLIEKG